MIARSVTETPIIMKVFFSYAEADRKIAESLATKLAEDGFEVWNPNRELLPGDNARLRAGRALEESDAMVVLLSPQANQSRFVRQDIEYALGSPRYKGRLVPVLVKPTEVDFWILKKFPMVTVGKDIGEGARKIAAYLRRGVQLAASEH